MPDVAATGFGYLELGASGSRVPAREVSTFREKPSEAGGGVRRRRPGALPVELRDVRLARRHPAAGGGRLRAGARRGASRPSPPARPAPAEWDALPKLSVDYGVMEPASVSADFTVAALPLAARWLDVGSWPAYGDALGRDAAGNAVGAARAVLHEQPRLRRGLLRPRRTWSRWSAARGWWSCTRPTATLVMPAAQAQRVKDLHAVVARRAPRPGLTPPPLRPSPATPSPCCSSATPGWTGRARPARRCRVVTWSGGWVAGRRRSGAGGVAAATAGAEPAVGEHEHAVGDGGGPRGSALRRTAARRAPASACAAAAGAAPVRTPAPSR